MHEHECEHAAPSCSLTRISPLYFLHLHPPTGKSSLTATTTKATSSRTSHLAPPTFSLSFLALALSTVHYQQHRHKRTCLTVHSPLIDPSSVNVWRLQCLDSTLTASRPPRASQQPCLLMFLPRRYRNLTPSSHVAIRTTTSDHSSNKCG